MRLFPFALAALPIAAHAEPLTVVTDIPPVHSLVAQVMGDRGEVEVLLDPNADPHHFQLRPSQARTLANADFLIWIGEDMTPWLEHALDGLAAELPNLSLLAEMGEEHEDDHEDEDDHHEDHEDDHGEDEDDHGDEDENHDEDEEDRHEDEEDHHEDEEDHHDEDEDDHHEDEHGHAHGGVDPHIWLNTHVAENMLHLIADHLSELDPEGAEIYEHNAHEAAEAIEELTHEVEHLLEDVIDVPFAVGHEAYDYFVDQFGLNQVGSLRDVHNSAASAGNVSELAHATEHGEIFCVFGEVGESDKLLGVLVEQGAKQGADLDPAGVALERGPQLYGNLIMGLATTLEDCLSE